MTREIPSRRSTATLISWLLLALTVLAFAGGFVLQAMGCANLFDPSRPEPALAYGFLMVPLSGLAFAMLGALINTYQPQNRFGWVAILYGFGVTTLMVASGYGECGFEAQATLPYSDYATWLVQALQSIVFLSLALFPWLFPDGRFVSRRWRAIALAGIAITIVLQALKAIWPAPLRVDAFGRYWIENPFALPIASPTWLDSIITNGGDSIVMMLFFLGIVSLVMRWRRSGGEARQQLKWLTYHLAIAGTLFLSVEAIGQAFYPAIFNGWFYLFVLLLFWLGLPVVVGLAIFKYRLYDIDIIFRRTLAYAILTALLGFVFFGIVTLSSSLLTNAAGQDSPIVIVSATLAIAALFNPLRRRVQDVIDRRFYRRKYNAEQVLADFARHARYETDLDALLAELLRVVDETLQPEHVSVTFFDPASSQGRLHR